MKKNLHLNLNPAQLQIILLLLIEIAIIILISSVLLIKVPKPTTFHNNDKSNEVDLHLISELVSKSIASSTLQDLKTIIKESYQAYSKKCFGSDFISPLTGECVNYSGISLTAIDALDTLILIGDSEGVEQINNFLQSKNFFCKAKSNELIHTKHLISHFIGGLISAYCLTSNKLYIRKAIECADFSLSAFHGDIPKPLINGNAKQSQDYLWAKGTTLSESSSFPVEFNGLSCISKNKKYSFRIKNYFNCISKIITSQDELFLFLSTDTCSNSSDKFGISPLSISFLANTIRYHILSPSNETENILNWFERKYESLNLKEIVITNDSLDPRFDSTICQLLPLLRYYNQQKYSRIIKKLNSKCHFMAEKGLPSISAQIKKKYIEIDQNGFDFESSLIEDLIVNGEIQEHDLKRDFINATKNRIRCKNALCKLYSQDPDIIQNIMPSISLSKWLKFLLFENGGIKYDKFIFNEAGHIIPKC